MVRGVLPTPAARVAINSYNTERISDGIKYPVPEYPVPAAAQAVLNYSQDHRVTSSPGRVVVPRRSPRNYRRSLLPWTGYGPQLKLASLVDLIVILRFCVPEEGIFAGGVSCVRFACTVAGYPSFYAGPGTGTAKRAVFGTRAQYYYYVTRAVFSLRYPGT
eukprot:1607467-Rhodomonas_salina.1